MLKLTLRKSWIGRPQKQLNILKSLGFGKKINSSVVVKDTDANRKSIQKITHLIEIEEVTE